MPAHLAVRRVACVHSRFLQRVTSSLSLAESCTDGLSLRLAKPVDAPLVVLAWLIGWARRSGYHRHCQEPRGRNLPEAPVQAAQKQKNDFSVKEAHDCDGMDRHIHGMTTDCVARRSLTPPWRSCAESVRHRQETSKTSYEPEVLSPNLEIVDQIQDQVLKTRNLHWRSLETLSHVILEAANPATLQDALVRTAP